MLSQRPRVQPAQQEHRAEVIIFTVSRRPEHWEQVVKGQGPHELLERRLGLRRSKGDAAGDIGVDA
jgi:hypothetical protein